MSTDTAVEDEPQLDSTTNVEEVRAQLAIVEEENQRLRDEYAQVLHARYRKTAFAMVAVGLVGIAGGVLFETARTVLLALGATGVFAGVLTYYLTPERFLAASIGEAVYRASAQNGEALREELGLQDITVYVPPPNQRTGDPTLYVPQHASYVLPDSFETLFVTGTDEAQRGIALTPSAATLNEEFEKAVTGDRASTPNDALVQLTDALEAQFELVENTRIDVDTTTQRATIGIHTPAFGRLTQFDHPVSSFIGVGLATALDQPVTIETTTGDDRMEYLITASWEA